MSLLRITHSLLASYMYATDSESPDNAYDRFLRVLNREKEPDTPAMKEGRRFEDEVTKVIGGGVSEDTFATEFGRLLDGATPQVRAEKVLHVSGLDWNLVGVADFIRAGTIYDTKRVSRYEYGKYQRSTQHPAYFRLFPEANTFIYLIHDGKYNYQEQYLRADTAPIEPYIMIFYEFLKTNKLFDIYQEKWEER
jgi:hypothetical protein